MWVDASNFRILQRIAAAGPGKWGGPYTFTQHHPDRTVSIRIADPGEVQSQAHQGTAPKFDFATMGFLFGIADWKEGTAWRVVNVGTAADPAPRKVFVKVGGTVDLKGAGGKTTRVREVALLTANKSTVVTFSVTPEAPFFHGWDFTVLSSGRVVNRVRYTRLSSPDGL